MKIAWQMPTLRRACCGLSNRALRLADGLRRYGHEVVFWADARKTDVSEATLEGHRVHRLAARPTWTLHWSLQAHSRRRTASALAAQITPDHDLMMTCQPEFAVAFRARHPRIPLVFVCGGTTLLHDQADITRSSEYSLLRRFFFTLDRFLKRRNERVAFATADAVVFDSDATRDRVTRDYALNSARFQTIHGGVDPDEFPPPLLPQRQNARRCLGIGDSENVVAWTGRLSPEKNIDLLLRALACSRRPPHRVLIVGDGPARGELEKLSHQLGLGGFVSFLGAQADVRPFLHAADAFVFPSRGESFGGALVEAMACGLPCVALRPDDAAVRNANLEIIDHEATGLLVDRAGPGDLAAVVERLLANRELCMALGKAARRRAASAFTWSGAGQQLNHLLCEIAASTAQDEAVVRAQSEPPLKPAHA